MSVIFHDTEWRVYDVDAGTLASAAAFVSGRTEAARTEWSAHYACITERGRLVSTTVTATIRITMPRWNGFASASAAEQREWRRFVDALRDHEQGHLDLVVRHLSDVDQRLIGRTTANAESAWRRALAALDAATKEYDRETDHGRRQGTSIDVSVGAL
jgi:predicted secreted Zn-dependent protease